MSPTVLTRGPVVWARTLAEEIGYAWYAWKSSDSCITERLVIAVILALAVLALIAAFSIPSRKDKV